MEFDEQISRSAAAVNDLDFFLHSHRCFAVIWDMTWSNRSLWIKFPVFESWYRVQQWSEMLHVTTKCVLFTYYYRTTSSTCDWLVNCMGAVTPRHILIWAATIKHGTVMAWYGGGDDVRLSSCISRWWQHSSLVPDPVLIISWVYTIPKPLIYIELCGWGRRGRRFLNGAAQCKSKLCWVLSCGFVFVRWEGRKQFTPV